MFLLLASASAALVCANPTHHDGDAIRCEGERRSMRLYAIDAPEMPGSCREGRKCTPGDPVAARDHLAALTRSREVRCEAVDKDHYGRTIARCTADGEDLSCAMVADGFAVERYGQLTCDGAPRPRPRQPAESVPDVISVSLPKVGIGWPLLAAYLLMLNLATYIAFWIDKRRARGGQFRVSEAQLLWMAALGGSPGAVLARRHFRHKTRKQPFSAMLAGIVALQLGGLVGIGWLTARIFTA